MKDLNKNNLDKEREIEDLNNLLTKKSQALNKNIDFSKEKELIERQNSKL